MISFIIGTHSDFGQGLLNALTMIYGQVEDIHFVSLGQELGFEEYAEQIKNVYNQEKAKNHQVVFLVDLFGATPFNTSVFASGEDKESIIFYGVNLPLLLELTVLRSSSSTYDEFKSSLNGLIERTRNALGYTTAQEFLEG